MANFNIYYTEGTEEGAEYIRSNSILSQHNAAIRYLSASQVSGQAVFQTSPTLLQILTLDKPDYIITNPDDRDEPILSIETSTHAPVGQNEMQRYARAVASILNEVPAAFLFAGKKYITHRDGTTHLREAHKIYRASYNASFIFHLPLLTFDWPFEDNPNSPSGGLVMDSTNMLPPIPTSSYSEIADMFKFINTTVEYYLDRKLPELIHNTFIKKRLEKMKNACSDEYVRIGRNPGFTNAVLIETSKFGDFLQNETGLFDKNNSLMNLFINSPLALSSFWSRDKTLILWNDADPLAGNRGYGDPYSGTLAAVDFIHCRKFNDTLSRNRRWNLVYFFKHPNSTRYYKNNLRIPVNFNRLTSLKELKEITVDIFLRNPFQLGKSIKTFFSLADIILLPDNLYIGREQI